MSKLHNFLLLFAVFVSLFQLSACMSNDPKEVAKSFLIAVEMDNYDEARELSTPQTAKIIDLLESLSHMDNSVKSENQTNDIRIISEKIVNDTAYVVFESDPKDGRETLMLIKVEGDWKANVTKEDLSEKDVLDTGEYIEEDQIELLDNE